MYKLRRKKILPIVLASIVEAENFSYHPRNIIHNNKLLMCLPLRYSVLFIPFSHKIYNLHSIQDSVIHVKEIPVSRNQSIRKSCFSSRFGGGGEGDNFILRKIGVASNALSGKKAYLIDFSDCGRIMDGPDCVSPRGHVYLSHFECLFHLQHCVECSGMTDGIWWTHSYEEKSKRKRYSTPSQK
jgi:hypothetical protein